MKQKYEPSATEKKLFYELHLLGLKPIPQYKISQMHVDIAFPEEKLVIEVNGEHHNNPAEKERDKKRYYVLKREGWKRKTYSAKQVHYYPKDVAEKIKFELDNINGVYEQNKTIKNEPSRKNGWKTSFEVTSRKHKEGLFLKKLLKWVIIIFIFLFIISFLKQFITKEMLSVLIGGLMLLLYIFLFVIKIGKE